MRFLTASTAIVFSLLGAALCGDPLDYESGADYGTLLLAAVLMMGIFGLKLGETLTQVAVARPGGRN